MLRDKSYIELNRGIFFWLSRINVCLLLFTASEDNRGSQGDGLGLLGSLVCPGGADPRRSWGFEKIRAW